jgi:flagellar capping protein FliD
MAFIGTGFIDPKDYPFKKYIDEQKHLDCDEHRDKMTTITVRVEDQVGEEHLYCDPSQLCPEGKFRRPKKLIEAERRGFKGVAKMDQADQAAKEKAKADDVDTLTARSKGLEDHARDLEAKLAAATEATEALRAESEARFNKLAEIVMALQK